MCTPLPAPLFPTHLTACSIYDVTQTATDYSNQTINRKCWNESVGLVSEV